MRNKGLPTFPNCTGLPRPLDKPPGIAMTVIMSFILRGLNHTGTDAILQLDIVLVKPQTHRPWRQRFTGILGLQVAETRLLFLKFKSSCLKLWKDLVDDVFSHWRVLNCPALFKRVGQNAILQSRDYENVHFPALKCCSCWKLTGTLGEIDGFFIKWKTWVKGEIIGM